MEFTEEQWLGLRRHATDRGLLFLSSPFSMEALALLERVGVAAWKVASGEVPNEPMIARMIATGLPLLLSTGMSPLEEIDRVVRQASAAGVPVAVMQCTTAYPCPPERIGLNLLEQFRGRYRCAVGLSDHSGKIYPGLAAATLGADLLEVHVTMSREMFGPDIGASVTTSELRQLVDGIRFIERMRASPVDKDSQSVEAAPLRALFTKSIVARVAIPAGTVLRAEHLALKKPGTGMPAARLPQLVGTRVARALVPDQLLTEPDLAETT
jgi:N-acetylneuraminate synthase